MARGVTRYPTEIVFFRVKKIPVLLILRINYLYSKFRLTSVQSFQREEVIDIQTNFRIYNISVKKCDVIIFTTYFESFLKSTFCTNQFCKRFSRRFKYKNAVLPVPMKNGSACPYAWANSQYQQNICTTLCSRLSQHTNIGSLFDCWIVACYATPYKSGIYSVGKPRRYKFPFRHTRRYSRARASSRVLRVVTQK